MARKSYLEVALENAKQNGWELVAKVDGLPSLDNPRSNLYKAMRAAQEQHPGRDVDFVMGGHRYRGSDGWHMAVIVKMDNPA